MIIKAYSLKNYSHRNLPSKGNAAWWLGLQKCLPLLLVFAFLIGRFSFAFHQSFLNKKRANRFALINEVQVRLQNVSYIEMVQQQTVAQTLVADKSNNTKHQLISTARKHALLNVFYKGSYIEPPQWPA